MFIGHDFSDFRIRRMDRDGVSLIVDEEGKAPMPRGTAVLAGSAVARPNRLQVDEESQGKPLGKKRCSKLQTPNYKLPNFKLHERNYTSYRGRVCTQALVCSTLISTA